MTTNDSRSPKPKRRRRYQFSLRTLLVFMLLCGAGLGWLAMKMQRAKRQREAVEGIREAGGGVFYDYQLDETSALIPGAQPSAPVWLRESLGDDFFCDVTVVGVWRSTHITDAELENVKVLTSLERLDLGFTHVTDAGLGHLEGLSSLEVLYLTNTLVTDAGLKHLKGLMGLQVLWLEGTQVTDEGVKKLQEALPNCKIYR